MIVGGAPSPDDELILALWVRKPEDNAKSKLFVSLEKASGGIA